MVASRARTSSGIGMESSHRLCGEWSRLAHLSFPGFKDRQVKGEDTHVGLGGMLELAATVAMIATTELCLKLVFLISRSRWKLCG